MCLDPVQREYAQLAPSYDQRWAFYSQATLQATLQRLEKLELQPGDRLLDVGCGTGTLLGQVQPLASSIELVGVDSSAEMLAIARQKLPPTIQLQEGQANALPFPDQSFNLVISTSAFHYLHQPLPALQEIRRILKPKGHLVITDWCKDYLTCRALDLYLRFTNRAHYRTYRAQELQVLLHQAGFETTSIDLYKINWFWGMMTATASKADASSL